MREKTLFFIGVWVIVLAYLIGLPTEIKNILFTLTGLIIIAIAYSSHFSKIRLNRKREETFDNDSHIETEVKNEDIKPKYEQAYEVRKTKKRIPDFPQVESVEEDEVVIISSEEEKS